MRKGERKSQPCCHRHQPPTWREPMAPCPAPAPAPSPGLRRIYCLLMVWSQKPALLGSDPPSQTPLCQSQTQSPCNRTKWIESIVIFPGMVVGKFCSIQVGKWPLLVIWRKPKVNVSRNCTLVKRKDHLHCKTLSLMQRNCSPGHNKAQKSEASFV